MKAMILAAGKGTRLHPITMHTPKPLIPVMGRPVIDWLLNSFSRQGINEFVINLGHLGGEIEKACQNGAAYGAEILYSWEGEMQADGFRAEPKGSAGSLCDIQEKFDVFDGTFVVVCGDAMIDFDVWEAVRFHNSRAAKVTVITRQVALDEVEKYGVVLADESGRVQKFQEKPLKEEALSNRINTGIYIFEPEVLELIPRGVEYDIGSQLLPDLVEREVAFYCVDQEFTWLDIGNFGDIFRSHSAILAGETKFEVPGRKVSQHIYASLGAQVDAERVLTTGTSYLAAGVVVEDGATLLGHNTLGRNCVVREGAVLENCIVLGSNLEFGSTCELRNCIVTQDAVISSTGSYAGLWECDFISDAREQTAQKFTRLPAARLAHASI